MATFNDIVGCAPLMGRVSSEVGILDTINLAETSFVIRNMMLGCYSDIISTVEMNMKKEEMSVMSWAETGNTHFHFDQSELEKVTDTLFVNEMKVPLENRNRYIAGNHYHAATEDTVNAVYSLAKRFVSIYRPREVKVRVDREQFRDVVGISNWCRFQYTPIVEFTITGEMSETDVKQLLRNIKAEKQLTIDLNCIPFESDDTMPAFQTERVLFMKRANWFDGKMLMKTNCKEMCIERPNFSLSDLNGFIRAWTIGKFEKLQSFKILFDATIWEKNGDDLLEGLNASLVPVAENDTFTGVGWHLTSKNGKFATMEANRESWGTADIVISFAAGKDDFPRVDRQYVSYW